MNKYIVNIKTINWLDKSNPEAEVCFETEKGNIFWAFSHPCNLKEGETKEITLDFIEEDISEMTFWEENKEEERKVVQLSEKEKCGYYCYGQIKNINPMIIDCGEFNFSYGDFVNDENVIGSYVYFVIARLDIIDK